MDQEGDAHFLVMELARGESASEALSKRGPLPWVEATGIVADGCRGLAAAHAAGLPAIAIGVTTGGGEHTPEEWIDTAPLAVGLKCAADTITRWERVAHEPA